MRPFLKQKNSGVCNINVPITSYLFGDDLSRELKKCETSIKVGKYSSITKSSSFGPIRGRRTAQVTRDGGKSRIQGALVQVGLLVKRRTVMVSFDTVRCPTQ
ncbi:hypothetical protein DPMN_162442 [Dreissena polymorpha]|uniref:Uncharacterized protein n=1 Tax=Dreissena polymorpha TaxID=45954 RepID=A0A9D4EV35_DREPO|nr:hypothetical protein DPMN_162442 [Dreissena polymorpha]